MFAREQFYVSPGMARLILNEFINCEDNETDDILTAREREVLEKVSH